MYTRGYAEILSVRTAVAVSDSPALAQSQAANGAIEGTVSDSSGGVLPGVTVTVTNLDTGDERAVVTNEKGLYRAPLLTLGTYRVVAELQGFKKFDRPALASVGQAAVVNVDARSRHRQRNNHRHSADSPVLDIARIDIGHTMSDLEVHNLPLVARNPYNFALVQPASPASRTRVRRAALAANGAAMRINYKIDGNTNTRRTAPAFACSRCQR